MTKYIYLPTTLWHADQFNISNADLNPLRAYGLNLFASHGQIECVFWKEYVKYLCNHSDISTTFLFSVWFSLSCRTDIRESCMRQGYFLIDSDIRINSYIFDCSLPLYIFIVTRSLTTWFLLIRCEEYFTIKSHAV